MTTSDGRTAIAVYENAERQPASQVDVDALRLAIEATMRAYRALPDSAPNPRDFEGPTQWADFDAAHAAWQAEGARLLAEANTLRRQLQEAAR